MKLKFDKKRDKISKFIYKKYGHLADSSASYILGSIEDKEFSEKKQMLEAAFLSFGCVIYENEK